MTAQQETKIKRLYNVLLRGEAQQYKRVLQLGTLLEGLSKEEKEALPIPAEKVALWTLLSFAEKHALKVIEGKGRMKERSRADLKIVRRTTQ